MDLQTLKLTAELSQAVYDKDDDSATRRATTLGCEDVMHVGNGGTHALIARHGNTTICTIRGTEWTDILDVERNLRLLPVPAHVGLPADAGFFRRLLNLLSFGWVMAGFRSAARQHLTTLVNILKHEDNVVIAGHSQGAAAALIIAAHLGVERRKIGHTLPHVVGLATPPPGSWGFNRQLRKNTSSITLVTNSSDPVCWVPPWFFYPRNHRIHFSTFGVAMHNPGWIPWLKDQPAGLWKFAVGVLGGLLSGKSLRISIGQKIIGRTSHLMKTYLDLIKSLQTYEAAE